MWSLVVNSCSVEACPSAKKRGNGDGSSKYQLAYSQKAKKSTDEDDLIHHDRKPHQRVLYTRGLRDNMQQASFR